MRDELKKLNVTTSIIPGGCTSYVQVLDVSINKIIKQYIEEAKDLHIDNHIEEWKAGKYTVGDRRVLMTHWVGQAWEKLHIEHKDTIIKTFRQVGLSLNPDGSEDSELKIRDLPGITVGDYSTASVSNPIIIPNDDTSNTIEIEENLDDDLDTRFDDDSDAQFDDDSDAQFDNDSDSDFDDDIDSDADDGDCYMEWCVEVDRLYD